MRRPTSPYTLITEWALRAVRRVLRPLEPSIGDWDFICCPCSGHCVHFSEPWGRHTPSMYSLFFAVASPCSVIFVNLIQRWMVEIYKAYFIDCFLCVWLINKCLSNGCHNDFSRNATQSECLLYAKQGPSALPPLSQVLYNRFLR